MTAIPFKEVERGLYRIEVPFEDNYTSVFLVVTDDGNALIDSGSGTSDAERFVIPALRASGAESALKWLLTSHSHGDHMGGHARLVAEYPSLCVGFARRREADAHPGWPTDTLADGDRVLGCLTALHLPGHSPDTLGFFDTRTRTLISGDSLQLCGVGRYGCGLDSPRDYEASLARLLTLDIENIAAAHPYVPLGSAARGNAAVRKYIGECLSYLEKIRAFAAERLAEGVSGPAVIASLFNERFGAEIAGLPPLPAHTVGRVLRELAEDKA